MKYAKVHGVNPTACIGYRNHLLINPTIGNTMKHTEEQWHLRDGAEEGEVHICAPGKTVAVCDALPPEECEANAERIVACVNACAGMTDPVEEITNLRQDKADMVEKIELALKQIAGGWIDLAVHALYAAIAKGNKA